jgi:hypothetical protein
MANRTLQQTSRNDHAVRSPAIGATVRLVRYQAAVGVGS